MLEILKNEGGILYKKLSYKKILVEHTVPVKISDTEIIDNIKIKIRYRFDSISCIDDEEVHMYLMCNNTTTTKLSRRFGVKMKFIFTENNLVKTSLKDGVVKLLMIKSFRIYDEIWIRDYKLKSLLND